MFRATGGKSHTQQFLPHWNAARSSPRYEGSVWGRKWNCANWNRSSKNPARILSAAIRWPAAIKWASRLPAHDLYANAVCIITPTKKFNAGAVRKVEQFWKSLGARTLRLDAARHDFFVSRSSHLPHVVAAALADWFWFRQSPAADPACARRVFATPRASRPARRRCGATSRWPTAKTLPARWMRLWRSWKNFQAALKQNDAAGGGKIFCHRQAATRQLVRRLASTSPE